MLLNLNSMQNSKVFVRRYTTSVSAFSNPVSAIACMDITAVVESARQQREEILRRKEPVNPEVGKRKSQFFFSIKKHIQKKNILLCFVEKEWGEPYFLIVVVVFPFFLKVTDVVFVSSVGG